MFRMINRDRLNRYRYEIAAALFLTVAAIGLLAAAALGDEGHAKISSDHVKHSRSLTD